MTPSTLTPRPEAAPPVTAAMRETAATAGATTDGGLWVFGYGSLMWDPGFAFVECRPAVIYGWYRALCMLSVRNRGTPDNPGLVLALDRGGSCRGMAFRVAADAAQTVRTYLWGREMYTGAYRPVEVRLRLDDGRRVRALTFASRPDHPQYYRARDDLDAARKVVQGRGRMGTALDYLRKVVSHLDSYGIVNGPLHRVLAVAETLVRDPATASPAREPGSDDSASEGQASGEDRQAGVPRRWSG